MMMETILWFMAAWLNDKTVKSASDGVSGEDKVLPKIDTAGL